MMTRLRGAVPQGPVRLLAAIQLIDALGTGMFLSGSAVIYVRVFGFSSATIAIGVGLAGLTGLLASMFSGVAVDAIGHRRSLIVLTGAQGACYLGFFLVHGAVAFAAVLCLIAALDYAKAGAYSAVLAGLLHGRDDAVRTRALIRSYFNAGFFGGSSVAALLLAVGSQHLLAAFVGANALSYVLCTLLVLRVPVTATKPKGSALGRFAALRDRRFLAVVSLSAVLGIHSALLTVALPLWLLRHTAVPAVVIPVLLTMNTVLAIGLQVLAARGAEGALGAGRAARQSSYLVAGGCLLAACCGGPPVLGTTFAVLVAVLLTLGELRQAASRWGLSFALAPDDARAQYLSAFNMSLALTAIVGAPLSVTLTSDLGRFGWCLLAALLLTAGAVIAPAAHRAARVAVDTGSLSAAVLV